MPLQQRSIPTTSYFNSSSQDKNSDSNEVIGDTSFSSIIGCLKQLSLLATHSQDLFSDLVNVSSDINKKINSLSQRASHLKSSVAVFTVKTSTSQDNNNNEEKNVRQILQSPSTQNLIDRYSLPQHIKKRMESSDLKKMPALGDLDVYKQFLVNNNVSNKVVIVTIAHNYSNPEFFINQWCIAQEERMKKLETEKNQQKIDKKARKSKSRSAKINQDDNNNLPKKKKEAVSWQDRYTKDGEAVHRSSLGENHKTSWTTNNNNNNNSNNNNNDQTPMNSPGIDKTSSVDSYGINKISSPESAISSPSSDVSSDNDLRIMSEINKLRDPTAAVVVTPPTPTFTPKSRYTMVDSDDDEDFDPTFQRRHKPAVIEIDKSKPITNIFLSVSVLFFVKQQQLPQQQQSTPPTPPPLPSSPPPPPPSSLPPSPPQQQTPSIKGSPPPPPTPPPVVVVKPPAPPPPQSASKPISPPPPPTPPLRIEQQHQQQQQETEAEEDDSLIVYRRMQTMRIPEGAIRQKMRGDGVNDSMIDSFFRGEATTTTIPKQVPPPISPSSKSFYLTEDDSSDVVVEVVSMPTHRPPPPPPPPMRNSQIAPNRLVAFKQVDLGSEKLIPRMSEIATTPLPKKNASILDAIVQGCVLKKVDVEVLETEKKKSMNANTSLANASAVTAILERRKYLEAAASESESDEEDDWN